MKKTVFAVTTAALTIMFAAAFISQTAMALEPESTRYQKGYNDGCAGITVPGSHTDAYLRGYAAGSQECHKQPVQQQPPALPTSPFTGFPCVGGSGKNYCVGYHDGAVQADKDDTAGTGVAFTGCPPGHNREYCAGYQRGYNDESYILA
jgi:hypothetical protein